MTKTMALRQRNLHDSAIWWAHGLTHDTILVAALGNTISCRCTFRTQLLSVGETCKLAEHHSQTNDKQGVSVNNKEDVWRGRRSRSGKKVIFLHFLTW